MFSWTFQTSKDHDNRKLLQQCTRSLEKPACPCPGDLKTFVVTGMKPHGFTSFCVPLSTAEHDRAQVPFLEPCARMPRAPESPEAKQRHTAQGTQSCSSWCDTETQKCPHDVLPNHSCPQPRLFMPLHPSSFLILHLQGTRHQSPQLPTPPVLHNPLWPLKSTKSIIQIIQTTSGPSQSYSCPPTLSQITPHSISTQIYM